MDAPQIVESIHDQKDAETVADAYHKFPLAGHYAYWNGEKEAQTVMDKWYPGYKVSATKHMQVFSNDNKKSTVINFNGTETVGDAVKTWSEAASPSQSLILDAASKAAETVAQQTGLESVYRVFKEGGTFVASKLTKDTPSLEERIDAGKKLVDLVKKQSPDHHILLTGYSLGGLTARLVAEHGDLDALLFNAAVGKHKVEKNRNKRIVEFRIDGDFVSKRYDGMPQYSFKRTKQLPRGDFSAWERLVTDTDRLGQPTDPIQSHWLENFALSKERLHDQLISESPKRTRQRIHRHPEIRPRTDLFNIGLRCKPCENGKIFCDCK